MSHSRQDPRPPLQPSRPGEEGYLLLGLAVACFLLLLALSVAAPRVAKQLERDRELESEHRALEYVRAIQLYYKKNNSYPTSVEQLLGSGAAGGPVSIGPGASLKFLRQRYKDPLTGDEFRLIHPGEAKTQVKGFFGEPLQGIPTGNLGAAQGMVSSINATPAGTFGGSSATGVPASATGAGTSSFGSSAFNNSGSGTSTGTGTGATGTTGTSTTGTGSSMGGTSATNFQGSKGAFLGVGSNAKGPGLIEWNGSANIEEWEFLYDPRVELLKAKVSLFGGGPPTAASGSMGSGFGSPTGPTATNAPNGTNSNSTGGFGSSTGGFGSSSSSGFGSSSFGSGASTTPSTGTGTTNGNGTTNGSGNTVGVPVLP